MTGLNEQLASQIFPGSDFATYHSVMSGPLRGLLQMPLHMLESLLAASVGITLTPNNAPLILLRVLNERMADPLNLLNFALLTSLKPPVMQ
jgi:hypothetical protein